jgi:hypothetical protein
VAFAMALRPGGVVVVRPRHGSWQLVHAGEQLGTVTLSTQQGSAVTTADGTVWTVSGSVVPADLTLWHEGSGAGVAWCAGGRVRRSATIDVAGLRDPLAYRARLLRGGGSLDTGDGPAARVSWSHESGRMGLSFDLAERPDIASFAPAIAIVAVWLIATDALVPRQAGTWSAGP